MMVKRVSLDTHVDVYEFPRASRTRLDRYREIKQGVNPHPLDKLVLDGLPSAVVDDSGPYLTITLIDRELDQKSLKELLRQVHLRTRPTVPRRAITVESEAFGRMVIDLEAEGRGRSSFPKKGYFYHLLNTWRKEAPNWGLNPHQFDVDPNRSSGPDATNKVRSLWQNLFWKSHDG